MISYLKLSLLYWVWIIEIRHTTAYLKRVVQKKKCKVVNRTMKSVVQNEEKKGERSTQVFKLFLRLFKEEERGINDKEKNLCWGRVFFGT